MLSRMADTHRPTFTTNCNTSTQPWTERETFIFSPNRSLDLIDKFKEDTKLYCRQLLSASKEYEIWIHNVGKVQCTANNWLLDTQESDCLKNFQEKYIWGWRYWWGMMTWGVVLCETSGCGWCVGVPPGGELAHAELLQGAVKTPPATPHDLSLPASPQGTRHILHTSTASTGPRELATHFNMVQWFFSTQVEAVMRNFCVTVDTVWTVKYECLSSAVPNKRV